MEEKKNVYITIHKSFVREQIPYIDQKTGQERTFNKVVLPKGTVIDGQDVSYFEFSPLFVNPSKYKGENFRDIPLLTNKEVWLKKDLLDETGESLMGPDGRQQSITVKVMPAQLKAAVDAGRAEYLKGLGDRAKDARESSDALNRNAERGYAREDIAF